jgi:hypothetical protein
MNKTWVSLGNWPSDLKENITVMLTYKQKPRKGLRENIILKICLECKTTSLQLKFSLFPYGVKKFIYIKTLLQN